MVTIRVISVKPSGSAFDVIDDAGSNLGTVMALINPFTRNISMDANLSRPLNPVEAQLLGLEIRKALPGGNPSSKVFLTDQLGISYQESTV